MPAPVNCTNNCLRSYRTSPRVVKLSISAFTFPRLRNAQVRAAKTSTPTTDFITFYATLPVSLAELTNIELEATYNRLDNGTNCNYRLGSS